MSSGIASSGSCFGRKPLLQEIYDYIENSRTMEYLWSQKTDDVGHTGVVVKFDQTPKASIDFGGVIETDATKLKAAAVGAVVFSAGMSKSVSPCSEKIADAVVRKFTLEGRVTLKDFVPSQVDIKGKLVKLPLRSRAEKKQALKVFNAIKDVDVGDYQLMTNNCRHYVIAIAKYLKILPEFKDKNWREFEQEMETILERDNQKFQDCLSSCSYFLSQTLLKEEVKSEDNRNEYVEIDTREQIF